VFPPHTYTLASYNQIPVAFGAVIWTSLRLGIAAIRRYPYLGVPAGIYLSRHGCRGKTLISNLLLAPNPARSSRRKIMRLVSDGPPLDHEPHPFHRCQ